MFEDLQIHRWKMMVGVWIELALKLGKWLHIDWVPLGVRVPLRAIHSVNLRIHRLQRPQHVVEGTVLHHEHNDVLQGVKACGHRAAPFLRATGMSRAFFSLA
jgi:hypothetical protein